MDTTAIKSQIEAGEAQPKHDQSGMTKLLVTIPLAWIPTEGEMANN